MTAPESEALANKAGLSLSPRENSFADIKTRNQGQYRRLLKSTALSERMLQYYAAGKEPTKQALLAIAVSIGLKYDQIQTLLSKYGFCLSNSLPNDAVVSWFLDNSSKYESLLYSINEVLEALDLPILMTKIYNR